MNMILLTVNPGSECSSPTLGLIAAFIFKCVALLMVEVRFNVWL